MTGKQALLVRDYLVDSLGHSESDIASYYDFINIIKNLSPEQILECRQFIGGEL